ncbi:hypothetical protein DSL72_006223 [Monilinia vaccinii-corymbosi]|uniref:Xylanolytic transcriptional activator regulatory domain-containing protein n=1 Tax=Monilinia vaccinii-corymbosi TaxID=61207 RepID=A0A8A3PLP5_9HELO|nr:hypothetical protein DSL72_006223 [Monilinia vaccinii-corymbosi]
MKLCMLGNGFMAVISVINTFSDQMLQEDIQDHVQAGVIGQCLSLGQEESKSNHVTLVHGQNGPVIKDVHPTHALQQTGALSSQHAHGSAPTQFSNGATAPGMPPQDPRMKFDFLLHYTKPGRESLLDFFGTPTTNSILIPMTSTAAPVSLIPNPSLLDFPGGLEDLMQHPPLPILDEYLWNGEINTPSMNPSLRYASQLEGRLQELISKLATIQHKLSERREDVPPFSEEVRNVLFTVPNLIDFTRFYFDHWHPNCPVLHQPTYNLETVSLPLLLVIFLIGAAYSSPRDTAALAVGCGPLCEEFVFEDEELKSILLTERDRGDAASLQIIQAAFLVSVLQTWQNGPIARKRMRNRRYGDIVASARIMGLPSSSNPYATGVCPFDWASYIEAEARVRIMTLIYLVDCHYTIFNNYPPRLMTSEMVGDMASSDEAYAATDPLVCEGYLLGTNEKPRAPLSTSMEWLMGDEWNPIHHYGLSTLNLFTFLNCKHVPPGFKGIPLTVLALSATTFLAKSNSLWIHNSRRIIQALDRWKILWDNHLKHVGPDFTRSGFFKNSLEFWQLSKLVLRTERKTGQMSMNHAPEINNDSMVAINALMNKFQGFSIS